MWRLLFQRSALVFLAFYLIVVTCARSRREHVHGVLRHHHSHPGRNKNTMEDGGIITRRYQSPNAHSLVKSSRREDFLLDKRDFVPQHLFTTAPAIEKKQNVFEKYYESQGHDLNGGSSSTNGENIKSSGEKARKVTSNNLGYRDSKRVEDADESVNEVINSIINDDKNLEKAMSDETEYVAEPTRSPADDFDVAIEENTSKTSGGSLYEPAKWTPKVDAHPIQQASQVTIGDTDQMTSKYPDGTTNGTQLAHSWSVRLESASSSSNQDIHSNSPGSHGNGEDSNPFNKKDEDINNQSSQGGPGKEYNDSYAHNGDGIKVVDLTKINLSAHDSFLPSGNNDQVKSSNEIGNTSDIFTTKVLNFTNEATGHVNENDKLIDGTNLINLGDEVTNDKSSQNLSTMIHLAGIKDKGDVNNIVTNAISEPKGKSSAIKAPGKVVILGNTSDENSSRNTSNIKSQSFTKNSTRFDNEDVDVDSHSHGSVAVNTAKDNNNASISNDDNVNVNIVESTKNEGDQNQGRMDGSNNSSLPISNTVNTKQDGKDINDISDHDNQQNAGEATPSSFLKQHPNAFKVLMEYFRKEASLQQKLRNRLNALRKTKITQENAIKKSFAYARELEAMPTRPLPLRDFVADFFKFATGNVPSKANPKNGLKAKPGKQQGVLQDKGKHKAQRKPGRRRQPMVGAPLKTARRLHNIVQAPKQSLPSRKADVTFLADFENATEVANEINGNISKIFQDAMNSNSQYDISSEPSTSSAVGLAEDRIGKIIAQNEIPQNFTGNVESNASNTKEYASLANNNANGMNGMSNGPLEEAYNSAEQTSPSEALNDFIHAKDSYMDSKTIMYKKGLKSLEASLSQDFFNFWMYHYRSFEEMSIKPEQLRSGIATIGSPDRLERVIKKALKGQRINILIVGGSISAGGGLERDRHDLHGIYYKAFVEWWKNTVTPITTSGLKLNVVAIGGTDSEYFSYCIKNYIHEQPDLVIWELAANDYRRYTGREMDPAKPLEQLTRLLLTLPSQPALIFINFFRGDYYKTTLGQDCPDSEDEGGRIMAEYYKITSLSWRNIICSQMKPTDERPSDGVKREYSPLTLKTLFSSDGYHPSLLGHAQCATLLISYIRSVFEEVVSREISRLDAGKVEVDTNLDKRNLPNPIYGDPEASNPLCWTLLTPDFHHQIENKLPGMRIIEANGFEFTNITRWPLRKDRLRCLKALHSDASLRIKFDVLREANDKPSTQRDIAVISHNSFSGSARVWLDNDQDNAVMIVEPSGQRRTQANIIKLVLQPGSHVITIRSVNPGFCVSAIAIL